MRKQKHKLVTRFVAPIALALGIFLTGAPSATAGADIYGVGGGSINLGGTKFVKFAFSGHTGPQGDFGSFRFTVEDPNIPLDAHVDVDCVDVSPFGPGAGGFIGGPVKRATPQPNAYGLTPGSEMVFGINDFGEPSGPMPDELNISFGGSPQICKLLAPVPQAPISQGNIVVKP